MEHLSWVRVLRRIDKIGWVAIGVCVYGIVLFVIAVWALEFDFWTELVDGEWMGIFVSGIVLYLVNDIIRRNAEIERLRDLFAQFQSHASSIIRIQHDLRKMNLREFGGAFYINLLKKDGMKQLFSRVRIEDQEDTLIMMLKYLVNKSTDPEIVDELLTLSRRHKGYGIKKQHFALFEEALSETLIEKEIHNFDEWVVLFKMYVRVMKSVY